MIQTNKLLIAPIQYYLKSFSRENQLVELRFFVKHLEKQFKIILRVYRKK
jgi:hypothetical protein